MFDNCAMDTICIAAYQGLSRFGYVHNLDPDTQLNRIDTTNDTKQHRLKRNVSLLGMIFFSSESENISLARIKPGPRQTFAPEASE